MGWKADRPLAWADFTGPIDETSTFAASTHSGIDYRWRMNSQAGKMTFSFTVTSYMDKSKSWTKPDKQNDALLKHEQLHFDISEYFARELLKAFNSYTYTSNYRTEINDIFQSLSKARHDMEALYDEESQHSRNKLKQAEWELYVANLLSNNTALEDALKIEPSAQAQ